MINSIQVLRAAAAWLVVAHHVMQVMFNFEYENNFEWFLVDRAAIGVDIFFVISGFIMAETTSYKSEKCFPFIKKRLIRIVPAYWFYTVLTAGFLILLPGFYAMTGFTNISLIQSLLFIPHTNPAGIGQYPLLTVGWTLNFEMFFYFAFGSLLFLPQYEKFRLLVLILVFLAMTNIWPWRMSVDGFLHNKIIYEFAYGWLLSILYREQSSKLSPAISVLVILASFFVIIYIDKSGHIYWGLASAFLVYGFLNLESQLKNIGFVLHLGNCSYSTYLCHVPILYLFKYAKIIIPGYINNWVIVTCSMLFVYFVSNVSYKHLELKSASFIKSYGRNNL